MELQLENSMSCRYDFVLVMDGPPTSPAPLGKFCGNSTQEYIESRSNVMTILFKSDSTKTKKGFEAYWFAQPTPTEPSTTSSTTPSKSPSTEIKGTIILLVLLSFYLLNFFIMHFFTLTLTRIPLEDWCCLALLHVSDINNCSTSQMFIWNRFLAFDFKIQSVSPHNRLFFPFLHFFWCNSFIGELYEHPENKDINWLR